MSSERTDYITLYWCYNMLNTMFWSGRLPQVVITLQRHKGAYGYFHAAKFNSRFDDAIRDEIALNPDSFAGRRDDEILSTLLHEMVHVWQHHYGKPSRNGYHNREWANEMVRVGLMPSDTGTWGGKQTGQALSHYILGDSVFKGWCGNIYTEGKRLQWESGCSKSAVPAGGFDEGEGEGEGEGTSEPKKKAAKNKVKYTCSDCDANVWGKSGLKIICAHCSNTDLGTGVMELVYFTEVVVAT